MRAASVRQILRLGILAVLVASVALGMSQGAWGQASGEVRMRQRDGVRMQQLDPLVMGRAQDWFVSSQIYNGLVRFKLGTAEFEPDLAERWETSQDGLTITFFLRRGVKWQKGYGEVTADDVKFTFDRLIDPRGPSIFKGELKTIRSVDVRDRHTVVFRLEERNVAMLSNFALREGFIVPKRAVEQLGRDFGIKAVGSGPFIFEGVTPSGEVTLVANPDYFREPPKIKKIVMIPISEETIVAGSMLKGDIHWAILNEPESRKMLVDKPGVSLIQVPSNAGRYLWINIRKAPMDRRELRQALAYAIDNHAISRAVFEGIHPPLGTYFPPPIWSRTTEGVRTYPFDQRRARELLQQGGYKGERIRILYSARPVDQPIAEAIQAMLSGVGINVELIGLEHAAYNAAHRGRPMEFHAYLSHFARSTDPDSILSGNLHSEAFPPDGSNFSHYEAIDGLIDAGRRELRSDLRRRIYVQIQRQIAEDVPVIPVINTTQVIAHRDQLKGYIPGLNFETIFYPLYWTTGR
ncbi:MAG: ABC transporter substrate-binding protein [Armatimonadota bacterium]